MLTATEYFKMRTMQEELNKALKDPTSINSNKDLFIAFTNLLSKSAYGIEASGLPRNCQVCNCQLQQSMIQLNCRHCICSSKCFNHLIDSQFLGDLSKYERLTCPCGVKISREIIIGFYGGPDNFRKVLNEISKQFEPKIACVICEYEFPVSDFITLECDHRYCMTCIKMSVELLIIDGHVGDEINCPECQRVIEYHIIISLLDESSREKYDDFLLGKIKAKKGERFVRCIGRPGINCKFSLFISEDRDEFECQVCEAKFCPKCKKKTHRKMTCEQAIQKDLSSYDPYIVKNLEEGVMKICPWCSIPVMKDNACKYVTCIGGCEGKRFFCWDCLRKLNSKHEMHDGCVSKDVLSNRIKRFIKRLIRL